MCAPAGPGFPPDPSAYSEPGDCQGGSRLAAVKVEDPEYPSAAFRRGQQGWVALRLDVDEKGRTRNVQVLESQPIGPFDGAGSVNQVLLALGVRARPGQEAFDAVGLGRHRSIEGWLAEPH